MAAFSQILTAHPKTLCAMLAAMIVAAMSLPVNAQYSPQRHDVWDLTLGVHVSEMPADAFVDYACGSNGGPPSTSLTTWAEFAKCGPEPSGLHEVYFRYDDQLEYWARAHDFETWVARVSGTKVLTHPAIISILFDGAGVVQGIRIVTDPRVDSEVRATAHLLGYQLKGRFGPEHWQCVELARGERELPMGKTFIKERCEKVRDGQHLSVETHFYRQPGQTMVDPHTREILTGQFESTARMEILSLSVPAGN